MEDVLEDWKNENIRIFKSVIGKYGCLAGWEIAKKFANFKNSNGSDIFEGTVGENDSNASKYIQVHGFKSYMCQWREFGIGYTAMCKKKDSYNPSQPIRPYPYQFPRSHRWNRRY